MSPSSERSVALPVDLHARPAGRVAQTAARFASTITIGTRDKRVDAKSVLLVMSLGATAGTEVTIHADGPDASHAVDALGDALESS
ncbi:MAG TPA: HPr family phosphocarrier protein [Actinomycetota bacterium]|nr:HPr family phosphocarrier protein [Actinomycetota bacterium]